MKHTIYIIAVFLSFGCGDYEYVRFETAQPDGLKASESFNRKVKGEYINCSNPSDKLYIYDKEVIRSRIFSFKSHRNDLEFDSTVTINRNLDYELTKLFNNEGFEIKIISDTVHATKTETDTIFEISGNQILKKFKGSYFLNYKNYENFWSVKRLDINKDTLLIGQIYPSDSLLQFDFVVKSEKIDETDSTKTIEYAMNPSKKDFKKLMKPNSFDNCECYYKMK